MNLIRFSVWVFLIALGCQPVKKLFTNPSPRELFVTSLSQAGIADRAFIQKWQQAWNDALAHPVRIDLPYREAGIFFPNDPGASGYLFAARKGQVITISIAGISDFFAEVYPETERFDKPLDFMPDDRSELELEINEDGDYLLVLQPEFLTGGRYELIIRAGPSVGFPVSGKNSRATLSFWGAARDGGGRRHEGIDIFAPRGFPVVAVAPGRARASTNRLGGNVVWLYQPSRGRSFYYAHLDSSTIRSQTVETGDTLGFVGNTGNARFTDPHLHFGIYLIGRGAVDPFPFIDNNKPAPDPVTADTALTGKYARIAARAANFRREATTSGAPDTLFSQHTVLEVKSATGTWYLVRLPDGRKGFIHASLLGPVEPLPLELSLGKYPVYLDPETDDSLIDSIAPGPEIPLFGRYGSHLLIRHPSGNFVWLRE